MRSKEVWPVSIGTIAFIVAAVLFLLAAIGVTVIPNPMTWGLFAMTLGFLLGGYSLKK